MSYCDSCLTTNKGQNEQLEIIRSKAKLYAVEKEKTVAIYREGYDLRFAEYSVAISNGYLITEVVSQYH